MTIPATITAADTARAPWDVLVIGAGPAGSVAALGAARAGLRTLLVDRSTFPRRKVCGGCLNRNALSALSAAGVGDVPATLGAVPLRSVRLAAGGRSALLQWPGGVGVSREALDAELIRRAIVAGASFLPNTRASINLGVAAVDDRTVDLGGVPVRASVVVVADGLNGQTAADAEAGSRIGAGTMLSDSPDWCAPGTVHMATAPGGYVGLVRVEGGQLDVAAAFDAAFVRDCGGLSQAAASVLRSAGLPPFDPLLAAEWKGTPALTRTPRVTGGRRWLAVGDAAGYVEPFTGEGIGWAVSSAVAVAPLLTRGASHWTDVLTAEWAKAHRAVVRSRQATCRAVAWALRRPTLCRAAVRVLSMVPTLAAPVVRALHASPTRTPAP